MAWSLVEEIGPEYAPPTDGVLPRRELRLPVTAARCSDGSTLIVDERSPEATRNLMILMQQGWERGRVDDLDDPAGISDNETE